MSIANLPRPDDFEFPPVPVHRFTVEEYRKLGETGVFDSLRVELLEGWIVRKMNRSPRHDTAIELIQERLRAAARSGWRVRVQMALTTIESQPEPDVALIRGEIRDYKDRHPLPSDAGLVVEVADSTLSQDRKLKQRIYARALVPCYWIVNLIDMQLEVHTNPSGPGPMPSYLDVNRLRSHESVPLMIDGVEWATIRVADLLP